MGLEGRAMKTRGWILAGMVVLAALSRLIPHPPNFAPICAMAFFGGVQFRSRWAAFLVPLSAMLLSDIALGLVTGHGWFESWLEDGTGFYPDIFAVYGALALSVLIGLLIQRRKNLPSIAAGVLGSSLVFFLVTNFAVWLTSDLYPPTPGWTPYPHTLVGLIQCFAMAIPFYHWSLAGDVCFSVALFGAMALVEALNPRLQPATVTHNV
jgi:uncharacterized protein DUF6580